MAIKPKVQAERQEQHRQYIEQTKQEEGYVDYGQTMLAVLRELQAIRQLSGKIVSRILSTRARIVPKD